MAKEWEFPCKICGEMTIYSDRSYRKMLKLGYSRPEYCPDHQKSHAKQRRSMSVSYFSVKMRPDGDIRNLTPGPLGMLDLPERVHVLQTKQSKLDESKFGLTREKFHEVYEWFKDPNHRVVVIVAATGAGKSTLFTDWLANPPGDIPEDFFIHDGQILVGQPRRVAASSTAKFTAEQEGVTLGPGSDIGYSHGGENQTDWRNLLVSKTHQQILNIIEKGDLKNVGLVMIDEAHERSLEIDSLLRNLKDQLPLHPHLRVIIASATIDATMFRDYFGTDIATIIEFEGKRKFSYLNPDTGKVGFAAPEDALPYDDLRKLSGVIVPATVKLTGKVVQDIQDGNLDKGDILVFMPGKGEVDDTVEQLIAQSRRGEKGQYKVEVLPLYRGLTDAQQDKATKGSEKPGSVRIIVSTNIAEASVTIESLVYVVDNGLAKVPVYDAKIGQTKVPLTLVSQANVMQRWGRAGRTRDGRVFCTYTEDQFQNLMPEYPIPAIQRTNLESLVIDGRATGLVDLANGWLQPPPPEEIQRATRDLVRAKALDADHSVTDYGRLLRRFNFPARVVDMFLSSDIYGCLIETATLVPMIKNGGIRQLLQWDRRWSAQTKHEVFRIHRALMDGCRDDIEFLLKIFYSWETDPVTNRTRRLAQRKAWAKKHFVNHEALLAVLSERDREILSPLYVHLHDPNFRAVDYNLISRTKVILHQYLGDNAVSPNQDSLGRYLYRTRVAPVENSIVTYSSVYQPDNVPDSDDPFAMANHIHAMRNQPTEPNFYLRLFSDQLLPVDTIYQCAVTGTLEGYLQLQITGYDAHPRSVLVIQRDGAEEVEDDEVEDEPEEEGEEEKKAPVDVEPDVELELHPIEYSVFDQVFMQVSDPSQYQLGQIVDVVVDRFYINDDLSISVLMSPSVSPTAFADFVNDTQVGDDIELQVLKIGEYPEDNAVSLVTTEATTGLTLALDPEDVVFAFAKTTLSLIPVGTLLKAKVTLIDSDNGFIKAMTLPRAEEQMNQLVARKGSKNGKCTTFATVQEITDERVYLLLDWSNPESGHLYIVDARSNPWPVPLEDVSIGDKYQVTFSFRSEWESRVFFPELPPEVEGILGQGAASNLGWDGRLLTFRGRMTFGVCQQLLQVSSNWEYSRAIRKLYWKSNQPQVSQLLEGDPFEKVAVGQIFQATTKNHIDSGVFVKLPIGVDGWMYRNDMLSYRPESFAYGTKVEVMVTKVDKANRKIAVRLVQIVA